MSLKNFFLYRWERNGVGMGGKELGPGTEVRKLKFIAFIAKNETP